MTPLVLPHRNKLMGANAAGHASRAWRVSHLDDFLLEVGKHLPHCFFAIVDLINIYGH